MASSPEPALLRPGLAGNARKSVGDTIDAGRINFPSCNTLDVAWMAVSFDDAAEKRLAVGDVCDATSRQVHTGIGMATVESEAAATRDWSTAKLKVSPTMKTPAVRALAVFICVDGSSRGE